MGRTGRGRGAARPLTRFPRTVTLRAFPAEDEGMRKQILLSIMAVAACVLPAWANDYIVARSSDPSIERGSAWAAGSSLSLGVGGRATLVTAGGAVVNIEGAEGGVVLPALSGSGNASTEALQALVKRPLPRRSFGAMRGPGDCPAADELKTLEDILAAAGREGCDRNARVALENYLSANSDQEDSAQPE